MPRKPNIPPLRRSLILDPIHPRDYREMTIIHCCEQCSHFAPATQQCTIGYDAFNHVAAKQKENYERLGRVAFCRFCEID
jgi:hypothetical protein